MKPQSCLILFLVLVSIAISSIPVDSSDNDNQQAYLVHIIKAGDSLSKIAYEYYGDYNQTDRIAKFNDIKDSNKLKIGQEVKIPVLLLEQTKKPSRVIEEDLEISKQGAAEIFEEKSLAKGQINSKLDGPTVLFIIVYLLIMLSLLLVKWLGSQDTLEIPEPDDYVRPDFRTVSGGDNESE